MAWTQADLDALETQMASGVLKVKYADKEVTYASFEDMKKARAMIRKALGQTNKRQRIFAKFSKGLDGDSNE